MFLTPSRFPVSYASSFQQKKNKSKQTQNTISGIKQQRISYLPLNKEYNLNTLDGLFIFAKYLIHYILVNAYVDDNLYSFLRSNEE